MKKTVWILAAALTIPTVLALGQQNGMSNDGTSRTNRSAHEQNHAMQTGSPNDNGAGWRGDYGKTHPGEKTNERQLRDKSKQYKHSANGSGTGPTGEARPNSSTVRR